MEPQVKVALIIAGAIIVGISLWMYLSPYQSCVRGETARMETYNIGIANGEFDTDTTGRPDLIGSPRGVAQAGCARAVGGAR